jgi:O-antigen/teichoic acid export membrane protein
MIANGLARALQFFLLLLTLRVASSFLVPSEMGKLSIITATVSFFALLLINPIGMFINRRLYAWNERGDAFSYLYYFWIYVVGVAVFSMLALYIVTSLQTGENGFSTVTYLTLVACSILFGTLNQTAIPSLNIFRRPYWFGILTLATTAIGLIMAFSAVYFLERIAEWWFTGLLVGQLIAGAWGISLLRQTFNPPTHVGQNLSPLSKSALQGLMNFAWPISVAVSLGWVQSQSYRFILEHSLGLHELGLFAAGYGISAGLTAGFESMITTHFQSIFYKQVNAPAEGSADAAWHNYARSVLPSLTLTAFFIIGVAPQLTSLLLSAEYSSSYQYVMWGAGAELCRITIAVFALFAHAKMMTRILIYPNLLGAVLAVALVWLLVPSYGIAGVGPALALSLLCSLLLAMYITAKFTVLNFSLKIVWLPVFMGSALILIARMPFSNLNAESTPTTMIFTLLGTASVFCIFQIYLLSDALGLKEKLDNFLHAGRM